MSYQPADNLASAKGYANSRSINHWCVGSYTHGNATAGICCSVWQSEMGGGTACTCRCALPLLAGPQCNVNESEPVQEASCRASQQCPPACLPPSLPASLPAPSLGQAEPAEPPHYVRCTLLSCRLLTTLFRQPGL
jgi:hypothetical protein